MDLLSLVPYALGGTLVAALLALVPALHIYNVAGLALLFALGAGEAGVGDELAVFLLGLLVGYAMLNTIPAIFLGAPDDSTVFIVLPGQKYLLMSRGYEAAVLTGLGGLGGLAVLVVLAVVAGDWFVTLRRILAPHLHWILGAIIAYMLMAEWPKLGDRGATGLARLAQAWTGLGAGLLTFILSGLLGFVLMYKSPISTDVAFQNLMPAFVGLFALPWVIENSLSGARIPPQHFSNSVDAPPGVIVRGVLAGALGGLFAAFFPVVTGGIGGYLAGHATAQRDDRVFIISQGACKMLYYVGAFWLFFLPVGRITRGGMAGMLGTLYTPHGHELYYAVIGLIALCGALSFLLLLYLSRAASWLVARMDYRLISGTTAVVLVGMVFALTGLGGLAVAFVALPIGALPVLWGSRRMNCLGVLLVPVTLNMAGWGTTVAAWLGII